MKKKEKGLISLYGTHEGSLGSITEEIYNVGKASEVGPAIRAVRKTRKITQQQLGEAIGRSREYFSKAERDGGRLTLGALLEIVEKGLGCKLQISFKSS